MKARSNNNCSMIEALEGRSLMSTVIPGDYDFNNDGRLDKAEITSPTTITVSLQKADGSYKVSATLTAPKSLPITGASVGDYNNDGKLDISTYGLYSDRFYRHTWLGNGDGTFGKLTTVKGRINPGW